MDDELVYAITGSPMPKDIERVIYWLMNEDFCTAYANTRNLQVEKGLALQDILSEVYKQVRTLDIPTRPKIYMLEEMAQIEYNLGVGTSEKVQLSGLVGVFKNVVDMTGDLVCVDR